MKKLKQILLVDDDKVTNYLNESLLKDFNIAEKVRVEINGKMAIRHLLNSCDAEHKICPELIIFDHHMPVMDGMEMMKELNEIDFVNKKEVIFILLAVHCTQQEIAQFLELGVQEYTPKPLCKEVVMDAYNKYFSGDTAKNHT